MKGGIHVLANLKGCPAELLEKVDIVKTLLNEVVLEAKLNKVGEVFHQFKPRGVTGIILIAESHVSIHTWPEHRTIVADIFTCGKEGNAEKTFEILIKKFKPEDYDKKVVRR